MLLAVTADLVATASDATAETGDAANPDRLHWRGYVLPAVGANSVDGFGLGAAGELFGRPRSQAYGYRVKLTGSTWFTTRGYTSQFWQFERRKSSHLLLRAGFQTWNRMPYAGAGGAAVSVDHGEAEQVGKVQSPYAMAAFSWPIGPPGVRAYVLGWFRPYDVDPDPDSLLAIEKPYGWQGAIYGDGLVGLEIERVDRWPMPDHGLRAEVDARAGASRVEGEVHPLVGLHTEGIGWMPIVGDRLVFGGRLTIDKTWGPRPQLEQFIIGGRFRDELAYDQALTGYGRLRSRGDGVVAAMVEVRPRLFLWDTRHFTLDGYLSAYAEMAWLFDENVLGPPLPTLGIGPDLLWQKGSQLRPFVALGWIADEPGGTRRPSPQFGLGIEDPL